MGSATWVRREPTQQRWGQKPTSWCTQGFTAFRTGLLCGWLSNCLHGWFYFSALLLRILNAGAWCLSSRLPLQKRALAGSTSTFQESCYFMTCNTNLYSEMSLETLAFHHRGLKCKVTFITRIVILYGKHKNMRNHRVYIDVISTSLLTNGFECA